MKTQYSTMTFEQDGEAWFGKRRNAFIVRIFQHNFEWVSDDTAYLSSTEHRDIACFLEQLNTGGQT